MLTVEGCSDTALFSEWSKKKLQWIHSCKYAKFWDSKWSICPKR